jgi:hypothetical protein
VLSPRVEIHPHLDGVRYNLAVAEAEAGQISSLVGYFNQHLFHGGAFGDFLRSPLALLSTRGETP